MLAIDLNQYEYEHIWVLFWICVTSSEVQDGKGWLLLYHLTTWLERKQAPDDFDLPLKTIAFCSIYVTTLADEHKRISWTITEPDTLGLHFYMKRIKITLHRMIPCHTFSLQSLQLLSLICKSPPQEVNVFTDSSIY